MNCQARVQRLAICDTLLEPGVEPKWKTRSDEIAFAQCAWGSGKSHFCGVYALRRQRPPQLSSFQAHQVQPGFIDSDNVYGFGAGADLSGDSVTDTYTIDTSTLTFATGGIPGYAGSVYNEYGPGGLTGADSATSTINGHTVTIGPSDGFSLVAYVQQLYAPDPDNQAILDLQAIGLETSGSAIGTEFVLRDEVVSYSTTGLPLDLSGGYTLSEGALAAAGAGEWSGVFYSYDPGGTVGYFGATVPGGFLAPEPAAWTLMLVGFGAMGFVMRGRARVKGQQTKP